MKRTVLIITMLMFLLVFTSFVSAGIDDKNEEILSALLKIENIDFQDVQISNDRILVVVESSDASEYDTEIIAWWGSIFGNAVLLNGKDEYKFIVIQNNVNDIPIAFISANRASVIDMVEGRIDDITFWDEVSITQSEPSNSVIVQNAFLPEDALVTNDVGLSSGGFNWLLWIIILIVLAGIILLLVKFKPIKSLKNHSKEKSVNDSLSSDEDLKSKKEPKVKKKSLKKESTIKNMIKSKKNFKETANTALNSIKPHFKKAFDVTKKTISDVDKKTKPHRKRVHDNIAPKFKRLNDKTKPHIKNVLDKSKHILKTTKYKAKEIGKVIVSKDIPSDSKKDSKAKSKK